MCIVISRRRLFVYFIDMSGAAPSLSIRHALLHVIMTFEAGTEAERRGHTADAVALLRSGTIMADSIIPALPAQHAAVLSRRAAAARNRMQAAHAALAAAQQDDDEDVPAGSSLKLGAVERLSTQPSGCYVEPPASAMQRPFRLLQQLASSIQGAAWLTPSHWRGSGWPASSGPLGARRAWVRSCTSAERNTR